MMKILQGASYNTDGVGIGLFFSEKLGRAMVPPFQALAFSYDDKIKAAFLFNDYTIGNIEIHIWAPGAISRLKWRYILNYVFNQLKCSRLTAKFEPTNDTLKKILPRLGFEYEATLKHYYGPRDEQSALVYRVDRNQAAKWIKLNG